MLARAGRRAPRVALLAHTARLVGPGPLWRDGRQRRRHGFPGLAARNEVYRRIWREAAADLGADFHDLGRGFVEVRRGRRSARIFQQVTTIDDPVTMRMALDKPLVDRLLVAAGVNTAEPVESVFGDPRPAIELLQRVGRCVVKPASGTGGGEGVTADVRDRADLLHARLRAARFDDVLLTEPHASGPLYRLLLLAGELLDVIVDRPPHVVGDGRSTVEELIAAENRRRMDAAGEAGLELLELDLDTALTLRRAGLALRARPAEGREVAVKSVTNDRRLEDSHTYRAEVHPEVLRQVAAAQRALGLRLVGIDVIAPRIDRPLAETGGVVIEVNGTPGIHRHYQVADRARATPVADQILERALQDAP